MGTAHSTQLWDPFQDPEVSLKKLRIGRDGIISTATTTTRQMNGGLVSPSTSSSSLAGASISSGGSTATTAPIILATTTAGASSGIVKSSASAMLMGTNAPPLYEHALVGDWDALVERVTTHPREASYKDKCRNMPLHVSCRRQPPPHVVDALITANPEALVSRTMDGLLPLHFACFCGSEPETVQKVLAVDMTHLGICGSSTSAVGAGATTMSVADDEYQQDGPTTTTPLLRDLIDRRGRTPLHCVCAGFRSHHRLEVVKMLLQVDPSCATAQDERGRTPLTLIVDDYAEELQEALRDETTREEAWNRIYLPDSGDLYECWQVMTLLLKAAYHGTIQDESERRTAANEINVRGRFQLLPAAVGVGGCPSAVIRLILKTDADAIRQKDADFNLPLHVACRTVGQPWSSRVVLIQVANQAVVYNADFGRPHHRRTLSAFRRYSNSSSGSSGSSGNFMAAAGAITGSGSSSSGGCGGGFGSGGAGGGGRGWGWGGAHNDDDDDVTSELLNAYPDAASVPDDAGKIPLVLAVESGKPWKTSLEPLWLANPLRDDDRDAYERLQEALDGALVSVSETLRAETVKTLGHLAALWPRGDINGLTLNMIETTRDGWAVETSRRRNSPPLADEGDDGEICLGDALLASKLEGLASLLNHVERGTLNVPETPQQALDLALPLLLHREAAVRVGAANVLGAAVSLLGVEAQQRAFTDIVFPPENEPPKDDTSVSTMGQSCDTLSTDTDAATLHGRAIACHALLKSQPQILMESQTKVVKEWMRHEDALVRAAACLVVGHVLLTPGDLKEYRSPLRKCMRATEDRRVLMAVARSLSLAARGNQDKLFLCRAGLPLLDAALMLSSTTAVPPKVQDEFHIFLYYAIEKQQGGLRDYMTMAQGENGRIMMTLATKTLSKLHVVVEEEEDEEDL